MATIKISQLPEKATMAGTEEVLINDSGTSKKFSTQRFLDVKTSTETARDAALAAQTAAETAETNAETAETNASGSATTAGTHATNASTSETNAATSETNAATSATSASGSATAAAASAASAAATYDTFDDRYLGNKASDPTTDNDGDALVQGMLYFDSTNNLMKVYDGSSWITTSSATLATLDVYKFTATSGQTAFTGTDDDGNTLAIKPTAEIVIMNGIVLEPTTDYTVTTSTLTLTTGATTGDEVNVYAFGNFELADHYSKTVSDSRYLAKAGGTMTGDVSLGDNVKAKFGASGDLEIYHDGVNSVIRDTGTGDLRVQGNNLQLLSANGKKYLYGVQDAYTKLYYDNSEKLATTSTGIDVTGSVTCDDLEVNSGTVKIGSLAAQDLKIQTTTSPDMLQLIDAGSSTALGSSAYQEWHYAPAIDSATTRMGYFGFSSKVNNNLTLVNELTDVIELRGSSGLKLVTTSTGIDVTGSVTTDTLGVESSTEYLSYVRNASQQHWWQKVSTTSNKWNLHLNGTGDMITVDSAGNVGVGTSSPSVSKLHLNYNSVNNRAIRLQDENGTYDLITSGASNNNSFGIYNDTQGAYRLFINSSGNVGIGTTHADSKLKVELNPSGTVLAGFRVGYNGTSVNYLDGDTNIFRNGLGNTERMRIDSSGNVLVGTTDTTLFNNTTGGGFSVSSNGFTQIAKQGADSADPVLILNQTGLDGEIQRFYKDGTTVGSIGTVASKLTIGSSGTGLRFNYAGVDTLAPWNVSTNTQTDGATSLGYSSTRFKDLYLSGTVNATTVDLGNWTITESAGVLYFATSGTNKMKLDASGNLTVTGNVTAYGTI